MFWFNRLPAISNPLSSDLYKVVLHLDALNPVLQKDIVQPSNSLESLKIFSDHGRVTVEGEYTTDENGRARKLGYRSIHFKFRLSIRDIQDNRIVLRITGISLRSSRKFDLLRYFGRFYPGVYRTIIQRVVRARPLVFSASRQSKEILFHTDYFLEKVPSFVGSLGDIKIVNVRAMAGNEVFFYVESNLLVLGIVDTFGPQYLSLQKISTDKESLELLWEEWTGK